MTVTVDTQTAPSMSIRRPTPNVDLATLVAAIADRTRFFSFEEAFEEICDANLTDAKVRLLISQARTIEAARHPHPPTDDTKEF